MASEGLVLLRATFRDLPQEVRAQVMRRVQHDPLPAPHVLLATCYRVEIYTTVFPEGLRGLPFVEERDPVAIFRHLARVAAGMDSPAVGEPQIMAQVRQAFRKAPRLPTLLHHLFERALAAAKRVRTETTIQQGDPSVVTLAFRTVRDRRWSFERVLLLGTGEMAWLSARVLSKRGVPPTWVVSRTRSRAEELARTVGATPLTLWSPEYYRALEQAEGLWIATTSPHPLVREEDFAGRPRFPWMVDLSMPSVVHSRLVERGEGRVVLLDSLLDAYAEVRKAKAQALREGERIVEEEARAFARWIRTQSRRELLRTLEEKGRALEARFLQDLRQAFPEIPEDRLASLVRRYLRKALHPTYGLLMEGDPVEVIQRWRV